MKSVDAVEMNAAIEAKLLRHPRHLLQAALCISASACVSITLIVWMLT
jgi:hypothetical protein